MIKFPEVSPLQRKQREPMNRINQQAVLPTAIKSRNLESFIFGSNVGIGTTSLNNNEQVTFNIALTQNDGFELQGIPYITLYVGSIAASNQLPGGSGIDESQWQVIGPWYDYATWDTNVFPRQIDYANIYVRNISAGAAQTVTIYVKWRYISPRENNTS